MVTGIFPPQIGGPATQVSHLCDVLQRHRIVSFVVTFGSRTIKEEYHGIKVYRQRLRYPGSLVGKVLRLILFTLRLIRILCLERPHVVHCHDAYPHSLIAGIVCRVLGIPTVVKFAGDMVWEKVNSRSVRAYSLESAYRFNPWFRLLAGIERWGLEQFNIIWAASKFRRDSLVNTLGVDPLKVRVIPNYVRLPSQPSFSASGCSESRPFYILSAGRFAAHKRLDKTLQALAALGREDVKLRLVGEGDSVEEQTVEDLIRELGLHDRVERLGKLPYNELISLMESSHVFLSTSEEEGFGIVFVEAMAAGLPVVAMRVGAVPEVVPDGKAGFLVEPGDVSQVVEKLKLLIDNPSLRESMGRYGRKHAHRFDLEEHWTTFRDLYREIINQQKKN